MLLPRASAFADETCPSLSSESSQPGAMSQPAQLPSLDSVVNAGRSNSSEPDLLDTALSILFEPSPILSSQVVPRVHALLRSEHVSSYTDLLNMAVQTVLDLPMSDRATFIGGHPRIGEVKTLSALSASEQTRQATSPEVLARLAHLNACYERRFPGLVYITFVNGRSRAAILEEMEAKLGLEHSLSPDQPPVSDSRFEPISQESYVWNNELTRAVEDVGRIAISRLSAFNVT
jgi:2-oxo-4-hydroxy-4-carboxy--5-ureidoimidazoline (OHCU) decarboxylase